MSYRDLPADWPTRSLDDPDLAADVVDLLLLESDRARDSLALIPCFADGVGTGRPVVIGDVSWGASAAQRRHTFAVLEQLDADALVVATSRRWGRVMPDDLLWHGSAVKACERLDITLLGTYVATSDGVFPVVAHNPGAMAS